MTNNSIRSFIELDRTFFEIPEEAPKGNDDSLDIKAFQILPRNNGLLHWCDLLKEYRLVILAEAGSGKTWETKKMATKLAEQGKGAFFLRLESINGNFEDSFETGNFEIFQEWLESDEEGWFFLDSVDEARLSSPQHFKKSICRFKREICTALHRTHIIITGRVSAWRSKTDLNDCNEQLPFAFKVAAFNNLTEDQVASFLIKEYRLFILAEAGSEKTTSTEDMATKLVKRGKKVFSLRLESIYGNFKDSFETGDFENFQEWLKSDEEGWFFLGSIDEARLSNPQNFERSIPEFAGKIRIALDRAHIIITGRDPAWHSKTNLDYYSKQLPLAFKVLTLNDLTEDQVISFLEAKKTPDKEAFLDDVGRTNAWAFTSRPQDLEELTELWIKKGHLGRTRSEFIQNSIDRRLIECNPNHADACTLSEEKLCQGAKLLAAAAILIKNNTIEIPDGRNNTSGIPVHQILPDWDNKERNSLLLRPLFDEAIYGTVRFHHRTAQEYLAAKWFAERLNAGTSRREIECLFFRKQYDWDIVTPALRPILSWLALWDEKIQERICRIAPEILLEGGDPRSFPQEIRRNLLYKLCELMINGKIDSLGQLYGTAQHFAEPVFSDDIRKLIPKHEKNERLLMFLFHVVELGKLKKALPEVMIIALNKETELYARIIAFRAIKAIAPEETQGSLRQSFLDESSELKRELLIELLENIQPTKDILTWLFECLKKSEPKEPYAIDRLGNKLTTLINMTQIELLPQFIANLNKLLKLPPVIERRHCEVSEKFQWLMAPTCNAAKQLILERHPASLGEDTLSILHKASIIHSYGISDHADIGRDLAAIVPEWDELNRALFWFEVKESRKTKKKHEERLVAFQDILSPSPLWQFKKKDFEHIAEEISHRTSPDDQLLALSLAFHLYREANQPQEWLVRLKTLAAQNTELTEYLKSYLQPPKLSPEIESYNRQNTIWKKTEPIRKLEERMYHAYWGNFFKNEANIDKAKEGIREHPGTITPPLAYLCNWIQCRKESTMRQACVDWKFLIPEFGEETARFYRDAIISFWRHYTPKTVSEGAPPNKVREEILVGLAGLDIEAEETPKWAKNLDSSEIDLACKYATFELNELPVWFPSLFEAHPKQICDFLMREIRYELSTEKHDTDTCRIISCISWSEKWAWNPLAPEIYDLLQEEEPQNPSTLRKLLNILRSSSLSDDQLASLASQKCIESTSLQHLAPWFTLWMGVAPDMAIPALEGRFTKIAEPKEQTNFAMEFIAHLLPDHRIYEIIARNNFKAARHLQSLYLLMHQHIRKEEDINHVGDYSPKLRDDAQEAREKLLLMLRETPGKEAFLALKELVEKHPVEQCQSRAALHAKARAEKDGDLQSWTSEQVKEFHEKLTRTPKNHEELAEIAILRLLDLKDFLENGDDSIAEILQKGVDRETEMRNYIGHELRKKALGRYHIPQEEEMADAKGPDLRFHGTGFDNPVPVELKLADKWPGPKLTERLENQLCGDYLRDPRSNQGIFLLVFQGKKKKWEIKDNNGNKTVTFEGLLEALQNHWEKISPRFPQINKITVIGIDLTKRFDRNRGLPAN